MLAFQPSDLATQTATLTIVINPLVNWIWLGFGVLALGTGIAGCFRSARTRSPWQNRRSVLLAATTALTLMLAAGLTSRSARRRRCRCRMEWGRSNPEQVNAAPRTPLEKELQHEIVCICGGCGHQNLAECKKDPCPTRIRCAPNWRR